MIPTKLNLTVPTTSEVQQMIFDKVSDMLSRPTCLSHTANVGHMFKEIDQEISGERYAVEFPGWQILSDTQALLPGSVTVICGSPGVSKSFFVLEPIWRWHYAEIDASILAMEKGAEFHLRRVWAQMAQNSGLLNIKYVRNNADHVAELKAYYSEHLQALRARIQRPDPDKVVDRKFICNWIRNEAELGRRVVIVDPITMMDEGNGNSALEHSRLIKEIEKIASDSKISVILVTHPRQGKAGEEIFPSLNNIPGSSAYQRFSDSIFWLQFHKQLEDQTIGEYDRSMYCLKTRLAANPGQIAYRFVQKSLTHAEVGLV